MDLRSPATRRGTMVTGYHSDSIWMELDLDPKLSACLIILELICRRHLTTIIPFEEKEEKESEKEKTKS